MPHSATDRVSRGLRWAGGALLVGAAGLVVVGIGFTRTADALITASVVAVLAFALPGAVAYGFALWLEHEADRIAHQSGPPTTGAPTAHPFREPLRRYAIALFAVLLAWAARLLLDQAAPGLVPFLTYFLAVMVAGWFGGFGPAAFATLLALVIAWLVYLPGVFFTHASDAGKVVVLGLFVTAALGIAAITAALHAALERTRELSQEIARLQAIVDARRSAPRAPAASVAADPATRIVPMRREALPPRG